MPRANLKYRCGRRDCRAIYHLSKRPDEYRVEKRCACGGTLHDYDCDRRRNKARTCNCDGLPHPHHRGTSVWCRHHPTGPTEADYQERYGYG